MKATVQVFKTDIGRYPGLGSDLSLLCETTQDHGDVIEFYPKEGETMNIICALLDKEVVYKLNLEQKSVASSRS